MTSWSRMQEESVHDTSSSCWQSCMVTHHQAARNLLLNAKRDLTCSRKKQINGDVWRTDQELAQSLFFHFSSVGICQTAVTSLITWDGKHILPPSKKYGRFRPQHANQGKRPMMCIPLRWRRTSGWGHGQVGWGDGLRGQA
jgi:hypothetical protein